MKWLLLVSFVFTPLALAAQSDRVDWSVAEDRLGIANATVSNVRASIRQRGSQKLRDLDARIVTEIKSDGPDEPVSTIDGNGRKIEISDFFVSKTINLARFLQLERPGDDLACHAYFYKLHLESTGSRLSPEEYLESHAECSSKKARLPLGLVDEAIAARELYATLVFAYLHELGHHYHDHRHQPISVHPPSSKEGRCEFLRRMEVLRRVEYEADDFAVAALFELGDHWLVKDLRSIFISPPPLATADRRIVLDSFAFEILSTHPAHAFRRIHILDRVSRGMSPSDAASWNATLQLPELKEWESRARKLTSEAYGSLNLC